MEPAILGILAFMLTVMLYLDRSRRNDIRDRRQEMNTGFATLRQEMNTGLATLRQEMNSGLATLRQEMNTGLAELGKETAKLREDMNTGFTELRAEIRSSAERTDARIDQLTTTMINLAESLGQAKGRTETLIATE